MTREELYAWLNDIYGDHLKGISWRLKGSTWRGNVGQEEMRQAILDGAEELDYLIHQLGKEGVH